MGVNYQSNDYKMGYKDGLSGEIEDYASKDPEDWIRNFGEQSYRDYAQGYEDGETERNVRSKARTMSGPVGESYERKLSYSRALWGKK